MGPSPRVRGKPRNFGSSSSNRSKRDGPSPRVRGKHGAPPTASRRRTIVGSIPARAGETHPGDPTDVIVLGSIPARAGETGSGAGSCPSDDRDGSIPARAGETSSTAAHGHGQWVHPRACGGKRGLKIFVGPKGPSPRVRGKLARAWRARCSRRVHPRACGGNTARNVMQIGSIPARAGENITIPASETSTGPPRSGSIPARAGETVLLGVSQLDDGPSPRVRGKLYSECSARICA